MKMSLWAMGCVVVLFAGTCQQTQADENPPGAKMIRHPIRETMHILEPVSITDKDHLAGKGPKQEVKVGDKVLIQIRYNPKKVTVEAGEVRFSGRWMAVCEIVNIPQKPAKKGEDPVAVVGVIVRAVTADKPCSVAVELPCKDGSAPCLYFRFDIKPKP